MDRDMNQYHYFLIIDLEATCCDQQSIPRNEMETIEIGAVMVDAPSLSIVDEFTTFIKPIRHPILTPFCTQLTSITQSDVNAAPSYAEAVQLLQAWLVDYRQYLFCSWGNYDKIQLARDSAYHGIAYPLNVEHQNIKTLFSQHQGINKHYSMANALNMSGLVLEGQYHRGIDDARNMANLMPFILGQKSIV